LNLNWNIDKRLECTAVVRDGDVFAVVPKFKPPKRVLHVIDANFCTAAGAFDVCSWHSAGIGAGFYLCSQ
jgi:hypothetical protein